MEERRVTSRERDLCEGGVPVQGIICLLMRAEELQFDRKSG
jgi:hypothetical protein